MTARNAHEICPLAQKQCAIAHGNRHRGPNRRDLMTPRNAHEICPLDQKQCAIAHGNRHRWPNRRVLMTARNANEIVPGYQNSVLSPTKMERNYQIDEFWWLQEKPWKSYPDPETVCYSPRNRPRRPKQCAISHENGQKLPNRWVLVTERKAHENRIWTEKQWSIAHENGQEWPNRRLLMTTRNAPEIVHGHQNSVL